MAKRQSQPDPGMAPKAEQILQGAIEEFLAHGFAATSMDRVAKTAGVSKATLYNHFGDKESLFSALTEYLGEKRILDFVIEEPEDPAIFLKTWATAIFNQILNDPELLCFLRLIIGESGRFPELAQAFIRNVVKVGINRLTKSLESYPQLRLADAEVTARVIMGALLHYLLIQEIMHGEEIMPMERDRYIEGLVKLVITD
ncbi:TetR/AcrR family transcriptional regulator [Limnospira fusiformis KN01]|uniref:TetR/AcrR family transcriptional regulator n=1 Tax=Limnospira TaxID=2596745 RepID=UPI001658801C|nr:MULTISPECIES: TetR/AcrR family transcriptional regulator [Limnospira]MDT9198489.1 TetR/AcrR family transcriptional regulator [Limnospira sp. PMC 1042.18]ULB47425.1 TetR/AcrR family transcriptional regulator [Limnospira fusiformis KN01]